jgi:hypothetical protein
MEWPVFVLFFACFSIWGSWSSAWRKKSPKKIGLGLKSSDCSPAARPPQQALPSPAPFAAEGGPPCVVKKTQRCHSHFYQILVTLGGDAADR